MSTTKIIIYNVEISTSLMIIKHLLEFDIWRLLTLYVTWIMNARKKKNHARRKYLSNYIFNFLWMHDWIVKMCFYTDIMQTVNRYVKYYRIGIKKLQGMICHKHFCRYLISILTYELPLKSIYIKIWRLLSLKYCKQQHPLIITFLFHIEHVAVYT